MLNISEDSRPRSRAAEMRFLPRISADPGASAAAAQQDGRAGSRHVASGRRTSVCRSPKVPSHRLPRQLDTPGQRPRRRHHLKSGCWVRRASSTREESRVNTHTSGPYGCHASPEHSTRNAPRPLPASHGASRARGMCVSRFEAFVLKRCLWTV